MASFALLSSLTAACLIEILFQRGCWGSFPGEVRFTDGHTDRRIIYQPFNKTPIIMPCASKSMSPLCVCVCVCVCVCERERESKEEDNMIENCSSPSQMIPVVQPRTQAQRELWEKKDPFFIPEYVGGRFAPESWASGEERCVFVLFFFFFFFFLLWKRSRSGEHTHSRWPSSHLGAWGGLLKRNVWGPQIA